MESLLCQTNHEEYASFAIYSYRLLYTFPHTPQTQRIAKNLHAKTIHTRAWLANGGAQRVRGTQTHKKIHRQSFDDILPWYEFLFYESRILIVAARNMAWRAQRPFPTRPSAAAATLAKYELNPTTTTTTTKTYDDNRTDQFPFMITFVVQFGRIFSLTPFISLWSASSFLLFVERSDIFLLFVCISVCSCVYLCAEYELSMWVLIRIRSIFDATTSYFGQKKATTMPFRVFAVLRHARFGSVCVHSIPLDRIKFFFYLLLRPFV